LRRKVQIKRKGHKAILIHPGPGMGGRGQQKTRSSEIGWPGFKQERLTSDDREFRSVTSFSDGIICDSKMIPQHFQPKILIHKLTDLALQA
jgi:hypothetical protein